MRWIIGDIHGMLKPLRTLIDELGRRDADATVTFVGDYVNRGPESRGVVEYLLSLPQDRMRFCRGNHDDIFDLLLNGKSAASGSDPVPAFGWFMAHGLDRTLHSYGIDEAMLEHVARRPSHSRLADLVECVPQAHRRFFRHLRMVVEDDDLFVVHARWDPDDSDTRPDLFTPLSNSVKLRHRAMWERFSEEELSCTKRWHRRGFFGHTPVLNYACAQESVPIVGVKAVLLDTAVALGTEGRLSAFCAETDEIVQTDHFGELVT
jgi:serine/threonine protein phosphatase 1